jgi:hypothetical protein
MLQTERHTDKTTKDMERNTEGSHMQERSILTQPLVGLIIGATIAAGVAWFASAVYREGYLLAPFMTLVLVMSAPLFLYQEGPKRLAYALFSAAILSFLSFLALIVGGQPSGMTVVGLGLTAMAILIGTDLALQDFGSRLTISSRFSYVAVGIFFLIAIPLSIRLVAREHRIAVKQDEALIRTVAQNMHPQGDAIVFEQVSPQQKEQLKKLVSVRTKGKTYNLADAEVESVVEERTVRRQNRKQTQPAVVSRAQEERMRLILSLHGTKLPDDITLFSRRGPITTSEQIVALEKGNPG